MKKEIKKNIKFKEYRFLIIPLIITFLLGLFYSSDALGLPIKSKIFILLVSFLPFILYLLIMFVIFKFNNNKKVVSIFKNISLIITCLLFWYYLAALILVAFEEAFEPVTNIKYYKKYVSSSRLKKVFPDTIPNNVDNIEFYYAPGVLQGGTEYSLYYVDKDMTIDKFEKKYKNKAEWIGYKEEYNEKAGLLGSGAFSNTPAYYTNDDDYIIYLVESHCDDSGYCNHGDFLFAAFNDQTKEIIYKSEVW